MIQTYDRMCDELEVGDHVAYANSDDNDELLLELYEVLELVDSNICRAVLLDGEYAGTEQYLIDTTKRCILVDCPLAEDDEDDEEYQLTLS